MLMVEILCNYMKKSSFDEDGFLKEKDPYHIIAHVKTNRSISEIRKEIAARGCCDELAVFKEVMDIFHSGDYIEGSFEVAKILSKAGHPIIPEEDMFMLKTYVRSGKEKGRLDRIERFKTEEDMKKRYEELVDEERIETNPSAWRLENNTWVRIIGY